MDQKIIDWALEHEFLESADELNTMTPDELEMLEAIYEDLNGLVKHERTVFVEQADGMRVPGKTYMAYVTETDEQAMRRELTEAGNDVSGLTDSQILEMYMPEVDILDTEID